MENKQISSDRGNSVERQEYFIRKNYYYYGDLRHFYRFRIPAGQRVLALGCAGGDLLAAVKPSFGVGVDFNESLINRAKSVHPECRFVLGDIKELPIKGKFDYIILSDTLENIYDIQGVLAQVHNCCHPGTRIITNFFNRLWEPVLKLGEKIGLKNPSSLVGNWLSMNDMENLFYLSGFETVCRDHRMIFPRNIPLISLVLNRFIAILPLFNHLCLVNYMVLRVQQTAQKEWENKYSVSIIIPTRDEAGNIPECFERLPKLGSWTELIFVDGNSKDGTIDEIKRGMEKYSNKWRKISLIHQGVTKGKGDAVRKGFSAANGDILMILDSDLTVPPEELPKFYEAIAIGRAEFVNGSRLIYPMEKEAMRLVNYFGNKVFSIIFTWLLNQPIKDTLCGTKVLWRKDYELIAKNRSYFGDFDPFGDFDLLFGASKINLKIADLPIHYRSRTYGEIKIERWKHALLLFRMCGIAFLRLKLKG